MCQKVKLILLDLYLAAIQDIWMMLTVTNSAFEERILNYSDVNPRQ